MKKGSLKKGLKVAVVGAFVVLGLLIAGRPVAAQGVEAIMRARETLALTEDQISRLDAIRRDVIAERSAAQAEMAELRSQLSAGQIRQSQLMAAQEERADAAQGRAEEVRARVDAVLTEEQRAQVEQMRTRGQRVGGRRPGVARGGRGGFGPGGVGPAGPRGRRGGGGFGL